MQLSLDMVKIQLFRRFSFHCWAGQTIVTIGWCKFKLWQSTEQLLWIDYCLVRISHIAAESDYSVDWSHYNTCNQCSWTVLNGVAWHQVICNSSHQVSSVSSVSPESAPHYYVDFIKWSVWLSDVIQCQSQISAHLELSHFTVLWRLMLTHLITLHLPVKNVCKSIQNVDTDTVS